MGCSASTPPKEPSSPKGKKDDAKSSKGQARMSMRPEEYNKKYTESDVSAEERGIITSLDQKNILKLIVAGDCDRKMSLSSEPAVEEDLKDSFAEKPVSNLGAIVDPAQAGLGYACRKGLKPKSPNQDSWVILKTEGLSIYGVFDGHGKDGHNVSNFVKEAMPKLIVKSRAFCYTAFRSKEHMTAMLKGVFKRTQSMIAAATRMQKLDAHLAGTTCTIIIHDHTNNKLFVAWAGDSGACLGAKKPEMGFAPVELTWDHKPDVAAEAQRIQKSGGECKDDGYGLRVYAKNQCYPGLNMSRSLGDLCGQKDAGVSAEPTVVVYDIKPEDRVLLACSDGVWEHISYAEAVQMIENHSATEAMGAAEKLAKTSWDRWIKEEDGQIVDDITALVIYLDPLKDPVDI